MTTRTRPALLLFTALAASCATPVDPTPRDPGLDVPDAFAEDRTGTASDESPEPADDPTTLWWRRFDTPRLAETVEEALIHNRDIQAAAARLEAAVSRADIAGADLWPQLGAGANGQRTRVNFIGLPIPGGGGGVLSNTYNQYNLSLDLSWEIDLWGRIRAGQLAAEEDLAAAAADLRGARLSLAARSAKAFLQLVETGQQLRLAEETAETFRRTETQVDERFRTGVRPAFDLRLARADRRSAEALVERRRRQLDAATRELEILLGRYPEAAFAPDAALPAIPPPIPPGLPSTLLERRPDIVAADRRLAAADARLGEARASLWPQLTLTGSGGTSSNDLGDLADLDFRVWSIGAGLLAPIFQGGRLRANVDLRDAQRREALATWAQTVLQAFREVEQALAAERLLAEEVDRLGAAAEEARAAQGVAGDRYSRGLIDVTALLDAQRRALTSETEFLTARRARLDARIDLLLALGGGFETAPPDDLDSTETSAPTPEDL